MLVYNGMKHTLPYVHTGATSSVVYLREAPSVLQEVGSKVEATVFSVRNTDLVRLTSTVSVRLPHSIIVFYQVWTT